MPARILAAADIYSALTERRPHRTSWRPEQAQQHLLEQATALGDRAPSPRERIPVREVVDHEDRKRGREAEQDRRPRQVFDDHHTYSSMWSDSGLGFGAESGSGSRLDFGAGGRRRFDTLPPIGVGNVGTGGLMRSRSAIVVSLNPLSSVSDAALRGATSRR